MACRFASATEKDIERLLDEKDSQNTKRSTKVAKELFSEYLKEKNIQEPVEKKRFSTSVKIVFCGSAKKRWIVLLNGKPKNIEIWTQQAF